MGLKLLVPRASSRELISSTALPENNARISVPTLESCTRKGHDVPDTRRKKNNLIYGTKGGMRATGDCPGTLIPTGWTPPVPRAILGIGGYALPDLTISGLGELVGACVPGMGMHSMPAADGGDVIFVEPMIARAKVGQVVKPGE